MLNNRVITVFGGTGFVGRQLVQQLSEAGYTIRVATRDPVKANILRTAGNVGQVVPVLVSYKHGITLEAAIKGSWAVINLIGILYETRRQKFSAVQAELPGTLARLAAAHGVERFVQVSAIGADEKSKAAYARAKAQGEAAVLSAFPAATILRPSIIFGPEDGFFNRFAAMARIMPFLPLIGGGHTKYQPVYVGDVAAAVNAALTRVDVAGKIYELGGPKIYTFRELMEYTLKTSGQSRCLMPVPFPLAKIKASFLGLLPKPLLTCDQVELLKTDNIVHENVGTLAQLGIHPTAVEGIVPGYLSRFRSPSAAAATA